MNSAQQQPVRFRVIFLPWTLSSSLNTVHYTLSTTVCTCTPCQRASFTCKTDSFLWGHGPDTLACKARPSFDRCGTSLSVSLSLSLSLSNTSLDHRASSLADITSLLVPIKLLLLLHVGEDTPGCPLIADGFLVRRLFAHLLSHLEPTRMFWVTLLTRDRYATDWLEACAGCGTCVLVRREKCANINMNPKRSIA